MDDRARTFHRKMINRSSNRQVN